MRDINRHFVAVLAAVVLMGFQATESRAQSPGYWVDDVPAGRGYFAHVEAIWLKRDASDAATLATLNSPGSPGRPGVLVTEDVDFDFETGIRAIAGMTLDSGTEVEAEYFGIADFEGNQATLVRPPGAFALNSVYTLLNQTPLAYRANGETELHSGEINLRRRGGFGRFTNSALIGFRYMHVRDNLQLDTFGFPPADGAPLATESTWTETRNNLFGLQLGGDVGFHWNYFHLTAAAEGFVYGNFYESDAQNVINDPSGFFLTPAGGGTFRNTTDDDESATAGVGAQINVDAAFNLTDNIILHAGYNFLALSDLALGSEQLPEIRPTPMSGVRISNPDRSEELGSLFFHGPSAGLEVRW